MSRDPDAAVPGWVPPPRPGRSAMEGRYCRLEPISPDHADDLFAAFSADDGIWRYMPDGPYASADSLRGVLAERAGSDDPLYFAIRVAGTGRVEGIASYLRITPEAGSIEVGWITYAPSLMRTPAATEAMFLMMGWAYGAGYRRYEWKCNALNLPSRRAAERLGFSYEGTFRQATVVKGRNRDTAWFASIDAEWPALKAAFETWLAPGNFDESGRQRQSLSALTAPILVAQDPGPVS
jgi:RimJ/RimL family protein N-acetyltransferase